ncbi:hypothetical protein BJX99DRAFT_57588 [Aspergillus californicus]
MKYRLTAPSPRLSLLFIAVLWSFVIIKPSPPFSGSLVVCLSNPDLDYQSTNYGASLTKN